MITAQAFAVCIFAAAQTYAVPPPVILGILNVEGGKIGQAVRNLVPMETKNLSREDPEKVKEFKEKIIKHILCLKEESKYLSEKDKINLAISKLKNV